MDLLSLWSVVLCFFSLRPMSLSLALQTGEVTYVTSKMCMGDSLWARPPFFSKIQPLPGGIFSEI
jgi:hypothetical protein